MINNKLKFLVFSLIIVFVISCERDDNYEVLNTEQTLIKFTQATAEVPVEITTSFTQSFGVGVSSLSSQDRTYTIQEVSSTVPSENYSIPSTVTIPANNYVGTFDISFVDSDALDIQTNNIILELIPLEGEITEGTLNISVFKTCPVSDTFAIGEYRVFTTQGCFDGNQVCFGSQGEIVELTSPSPGSITRQFSTNYLPGLGTFPRDFAFNLTCGQTFVNFIDMAVGCGGNDVNLAVDAAETAASYDLNDDSVITVNFTDNSLGDCGGSGVQAQIILQRL